MLKKFAKIKDSLQIAANHEDCNIEMHNLLHPDFAKQADTLNVLFANISLVTKILQRRGFKLSEGRKLLDTIVQQKEVHKDDPSSEWFQNKLSDTYIGYLSAKISAPHFCNGIIKIQQGNSHLLTLDEKRACKLLKISDNDAWCGGNDTDQATATTDNCLNDFQRQIVQQTSTRKRKSHQRSCKRYKNADFVLSSAAEVERAWSQARYVLTNQRAAMNAEVFEAIMCLKYNRALWDKQVIEMARAEVRDRERNKRKEERQTLVPQTAAAVDEEVVEKKYF